MLIFHQYEIRRNFSKPYNYYLGWLVEVPYFIIG